ncbi:MAG: TrmB family transcriptional regulator [Candidatus Helarchaeota archaeon]
MVPINEKLVKFLQQLDITQNDAIVYLYLAESGQLGPSEISKETNISRPRVYDSLNRLIERGFVIQEVEKKRPQYRAADPYLLISELEQQVVQKQEAIEELQKYFMDRPTPLFPKGIFLFNSDKGLRLELRRFLNNAHKQITIMAVFQTPAQDNDLIPFDTLINKRSEGINVTLLINVNETNWERCSQLASKKSQIFHYPFLKQIQTTFHIIDDEILLVSSYNRHRNKIKIQLGHLFIGEHALCQAYKLFIQKQLEQAIPFSNRLKELRKSIIYPTDKLKTLLGVEKKKGAE